MTVHLKDLQFHAFHGLYAGEEIIGSAYEVDCKIHFEAPSEPVVRLDQTYNYVQAYECIAKFMKQPTPLLETVLQRIEAALKESFPQMKGLELSIYKCSPPIPQFKGKLGVCLSKWYQVK